MKHLKTTAFIILFIVAETSLYAQFRHNLPEKKTNYTNPQSPSILLFNPDNLSINHSFSLVMTSFAGQSFSYGIYSNRLQYLLSDKWSIKANFNLVHPTFSTFQTGINPYEGDIYYGLNLQYRPSDNFLFHIGVDNYPLYYRKNLNPLSLPFYPHEVE